MAEIAKEANATEDQIERAQLIAQGRAVIGELDDIVIEGDDALRRQTRAYMHAETRRA